jgi:hypothetical protein
MQFTLNSVSVPKQKNLNPSTCNCCHDYGKNIHTILMLKDILHVFFVTSLETITQQPLLLQHKRNRWSDSVL